MAHCENCFKGYELGVEPKGSMTKVGALDVYVATPQHPKEGKEDRAIVLFPDIFAHTIKNPKVIADELSKRLGIVVYCPDVLLGAGPPVDLLQPFLKDTPSSSMELRTGSIFSAVKSVARMVLNIPTLLAVREGVVWPRCEQFLRDLRKEKSLSKIGCVGFCLGGAHCIVAANDPSLVDCAVIAHPGPVAVEKSTTGIKVPTSWVLAEEDSTFPPARVEGTRQALTEAKGTPAGEFEMISYPGTVHGFAARPAMMIPEVKAAYERTLGQEAAWFEKWIVSPL